VQPGLEWGPVYCLSQSWLSLTRPQAFHRQFCHGSEVTTSASGREVRLGLALNRIDWLSTVLLLLGALMFNQFIAYYVKGTFSAAGFGGVVDDWQTNANIGGWAVNLLAGMSSNAGLLGPLLGAFVLVSGVMLLVGVARPIVGLGVASFFWLLWYLSSATAGVWTFEYLFSALFGTFAALSALPSYLEERDRGRLLGSKIFGDTSTRVLIVGAAAAAIVVGYFLTLGRTGGPDNNYVLVAAISAAGIFVGLVLAIRLDGRRVPWQVGDHWLSKVPFRDLIIVSIGAMMCIQVFADLAVGWFTVEGYQVLVTGYAEATSAPGWWGAFLSWTSEQAAWLMPIQAVSEFACAAFLVTLLIRPLALVGSIGFFGTLMFSEFGASATIKVGSDLTWEWEMLFLVGVSALLVPATLPTMIDASLTWRKRLLGHEFFKPRFGLGSRILFSIGGAVTLFWIGDQTRMFGSEYASTSLRGALYFFAWLIALSLIDIYRNKLWRLPVSG
jgi:hypothetical protein